MNTATLALPKPEAIARLFGDLLGKSVTVKKITPITLGPRDCAAVATYASDDKIVRALCVCDAPLACNSGAALTMIPAALAVQSVKEGKIADNILENLHEILNVANQLFQGAHSPHVVLQDVLITPCTLPAGAAAILAKPAAGCLDVELTIAGYGPGRMSLRLA